MPKGFQPMLAAAVESLDTLRFPLLASYKLDGIRVVMHEGKALTRKLKPVPNHYIRNKLEQLYGHLSLDGELMIPGMNFNQIQSAVMSHAGEHPSFQYHVFDAPAIPSPYYDRYANVRSAVYRDTSGRLVLLQQSKMLNAADAEMFEQLALRDGAEGIMLRDPAAPYKCGRSTLKQQWLLKLKRFKDAEATVVGFEERMHNANEAELDERGYTKRSSHQENQVPTGTLGALVVRTDSLTNPISPMQVFKIGTGFDEADRINFWKNRQELLGQKVTFKYQELSEYGIPRFPVFLGFRKDR